MLSKKMTVSLMSLITIFALAFVAPSAMAGDFNVKIEGPTLVYYPSDALNTPLAAIHLLVTSDQAIQGDGDGDLEPQSGDNATSPITIEAYNTNGFTIGTPGVAITDQSTDAYPARTAKRRRLAVAITPGASPDTINQIVIKIAAFETPDNRVADADDMSKAVSHTINVRQQLLSTAPKVVSIQRLRPGSQTVVAAFQDQRIPPEAFDVRVVLTEHPHGIALDKSADQNAKNLLEVENGTPSNLRKGTLFPQLGTGATTYLPHPSEGMYVHTLPNVVPGMPNTGNVPTATGPDLMYRQYRVTITPFQKSADFNIKIRVKSFHDNGSPTRLSYVPPDFKWSPGVPNGREILNIPVSGAARDLTAGYKVTIPKDIRIPGGGYLVITKNEAASEIVVPPGSKKDAPKKSERTPAQMIYNVIENSDLPNLATAFLNGVVVDVESQHAGLVVSEVMWGEDVSLNPASNSQWIELYNPGSDYVTIDDKDETPDVNEALTLIFYAPNEFNDVPAVGADGSLPTGITDRIGTLDAKGAYWSPSAKGQSGRSGTPIERLEVRDATKESVAVEIIPTVAAGNVTALVSMYRVMEADDTIDAMMGQMSAKWASSQGPKSANFDRGAIGIRHGTPGAATDATDTPADDAAAEQAQKDKDKADADKIANTGTYPMRGDGRVYISEIMVERGNGLPQWIEISNGDRSKEFNLSGWTLTIDNAAFTDKNNVGASITFKIPKGTTIAPSAQHDKPSTVLVVSEAGRTNIDDGPGDMGADQIINLWESGQTELILAGVTKRRYSLISDGADGAFEITLAPPATTATKLAATATAAEKAAARAADATAAQAVKDATDKVGNLSAGGTAAWALPMGDGDGRSSIIRTHIPVSAGPAEPNPGTEEDSWVLASDTAFAKPTHSLGMGSYYGAMSDKGTPGFRAGGALPVELSHFRPERKKDTGAVVITWATQSELNNAGFFIKRSQQRTGEFKVINATMIAGAGTTSEKQFYTYTDTTAQPNVVYYYQIEDVSLDGNRQTLTRGIRLKGHVGAAGKATTLWGELKAFNE